MNLELILIVTSCWLFILVDSYFLYQNSKIKEVDLNENN